MLNPPKTSRWLPRLLLAGLCGCCSLRTDAQEAEVPRELYRVRVWFVTDDSPEVTQACDEAFFDRLLRRLDAHFGGGWEPAMVTAPAGLVTPIQRDDPWTYEELLAACPDLKQLEKLYLLGIVWNGVNYELQAREFDTRARQWSFSGVVQVPLASGLLEQAAHVLAVAFSPVGTIGRPRDGMVDVKLHAGDFNGSADSPLMPQPGSLLQVVIRRRRRTEDGVVYSFGAVPWTVLRVRQVELGVARCEIHSGLRSPLRVRGVSQTDRLAIRMVPRYWQTLLQVQVRNAPDKPLPGYQVFAKVPGDSSSTYVGQTDWQGTIALPREDAAPLKIYYVKHGSLLLARLPIVAGQLRELALEVPDDDQRLRAEGALKGVQDRLIDAVARREIHAARIGRRLETRALNETHIAQARELLNLLRQLPGRNEFVRELQILQRNFVSSDASTQNRIDRLFRDTRDVILRNLDPETDKLLTDQINDAERRLQQLRDYQKSNHADGTDTGGSFLPPENGLDDTG